MLRAAAAARRFATMGHGAEGFMASFPTTGFVPPVEFVTMPETGLLKSMYHLFNESTMVLHT